MMSARWRRIWETEEMLRGQVKVQNSRRMIGASPTTGPCGARRSSTRWRTRQPATATRTYGRTHAVVRARIPVPEMTQTPRKAGWARDRPTRSIATVGLIRPKARVEFSATLPRAEAGRATARMLMTVEPW
jgi:hypothetical protein